MMRNGGEAALAVALNASLAKTRQAAIKPEVKPQNGGRLDGKVPCWPAILVRPQ
jgi:hypothetical protein